jgi:hypothetical protein
MPIILPILILYKTRHNLFGADYVLTLRDIFAESTTYYRASLAPKVLGNEIVGNAKVLAWICVTLPPTPRGLESTKTVSQK